MDTDTACWNEAIDELISIESSMGHDMSDSAATSYLNDHYAGCICLSYNYEPWGDLSNACWG